MKSFAPLALLVGAATAALPKVEDYFPACSVQCLEDAVPVMSDCAVEDSWCVCILENYQKISSQATSCVIIQCGTDVAVGQVLPAAEPFCSAATSAHEAETATGAAPASSSTGAPADAPADSQSTSGPAPSQAPATTTAAAPSPSSTGSGSGSGAGANAPVIAMVLAAGAIAAL